MGILYGKGFDELSNKEKIKKLKSKVKYYLIADFLLLLAIILLGYLLLLETYPSSNYPRVEYEGLSGIEIKRAQQALKEVNPIYLAGTKKIVFTKNIKDHLSWIDKTIEPRWRLITGFNKNSNAYVEYDRQNSTLKATLCHELLHTHMKLSEPTHKLVYDLESKEVCYS